MWDIIKFLGGLLIVLTLLELLDLPDWIGKKLRGEVPNKEMQKKIDVLEARIDDLEEELKNIK